MIESPYHCDCVEKQIRRRTYKNNTTHYVYQCLRCGHTVGNSLAKQSLEVHRALANGGVPEFDETLADRFNTQAMHQNAAQREARSAEWWAAYHSYMNSPEWHEKRQLVLKRDGWLCKGCGEKTAVEVHHLTYEHFGDELLWELVSVCNDCHHRVTAMDREMREHIYGAERAYSGS